MTVSEIADRWKDEARRHEKAAEGIYERLKWDDTAVMDEEQMLHLEIARVLRNCAREVTQ